MLLEWSYRRNKYYYYYYKKSPKIRVDYGSGWVGKVVSYYDLSVLSMSVMGIQKKSLDGDGWVGGVTSIQFYFGFLELFLTLQSPLVTLEKCKLEKYCIRIGYLFLCEVDSQYVLSNESRGQIGPRHGHVERRRLPLGGAITGGQSISCNSERVVSK